MPSRLLPLLFVLSCTPESSFILTGDVPPDVDFLAALLLDDDGVAVGGTGVIPWAEMGPALATIDASERPKTAQIYGYPAAVLFQQQGFVEETEVADLPVRIADDSDPQLPTPTWSAVAPLGSKKVEFEPTVSFQPLTADWVLGCPALLAREEIGIVDPCFTVDCEARVRQRNCRLDFTVNGCTGGELTGNVDGDGSVTFQPSEILGNCLWTDPADPAFVSFVCSGGPLELVDCEVDVFREAEGPFQVDELTLEGTYTDVEVPALARNIGGMVVLDEHVVVTQYARPTRDACTGVPSVLTFVDQETMTITATVAAPDCMGRLIPDERGGFIGIDNNGPEAFLRRYDASGQLIESAPLPYATSEFYPGDFVTDGETFLVLALKLDRTASDLAIQGRLDTLTTTTTVLPVAENHRAAAAFDGGYVVVDGRNERLLVVRDGEIVIAFGVRPTCGRSSLWSVAHHRPTDSFIIASRGDEAQAILVAETQSGGECATGTYYEGKREPYAFVPWPETPGLLIVAVDGTEFSGEDETYVSFFDPLRGRFLPGSDRLGRGPALFAAPDRQGRVWFLLPFEPSLARVQAR